MRKDHFDELVESVREGGAILRGRARPSRVFHVEPLTARDLRQDDELPQDDGETPPRASRDVVTPRQRSGSDS